MGPDLYSLAAQIAAIALVLTLPGYIWLSWFPPTYVGWLHRLAEMIGLSLALNALAGLVFFLLGIQVTPESVLIIYSALGILGAISLAIELRHGLFKVRVLLRRRQSIDDLGTQPEPAASDSTAEDMEPEVTPSPLLSPAAFALVGFAVLVAIVIWRFVQVRELVLPAWVDSLHHVLIVKLILENGIIPTSFAPYMPVPFYYHFGFHGSAALVTLLAGISPEQAVLTLGQVINAGVVLGIFRLGMAIWDDRRRAGVAALLVGFVTQMPAYYATWGRYTLLTGLLLLAAAMAVGVEIAREGGSRRRAARLAVLTVGILLTHYFAALLLAVFLGILCLTSLAPRRSGSAPVRVWSAILGGGLVGFLFTFPWLARVWGFAGGYTNVTIVPPGAALDEIYFANYLGYLWYLLGPTRNYFLLSLGAASLLLAGWRRATFPLTLWTLALLALASPWGPRLNPFRPDHVVIVLFFPTSLLFADGLFTAADRLRESRLWPIGSLLVGAVVLGLLTWGIRDTRQILNPVTILADQADLQALAWIEANTPEDSRFYINVTLWQTGTYRGVDGGWWILPLTGRQTLVPPSMYILGEPSFVQQTNDWAGQAIQLDGCSAELQGLLQEANLDYVYVRADRGNLTPGVLAECPFLEMVFAFKSVQIFRLR
jgi:hypothetical protein